MDDNSTDSANSTSPVWPRSVLVVGGGPAGLVTLRNLVERSKGQFDRVLLVERRDDIGGVWYVSYRGSTYFELKLSTQGTKTNQ